MDPSEQIKQLKIELLKARADAAVLRNFVKEKRQDACVCLRADREAGRKCVNCQYFDRVLDPGAGKELLDRHLALMAEVEHWRRQRAGRETTG